MPDKRLISLLLPLLLSLSPRVVDHLTALADQVAQPPPPRIVASSGEVIPLGRAQLDQLRRAQQLGRAGARVRLSGGRDLAVDPKTGRITLRSAPVRGGGAVKRRDRG